MSAVTARRADLPGYLARGYNLMASALLLFAGLVFGSLAIAESDLANRVDDGGLLLIAVVAVAWYLSGDRRFRLGLWPVGLAAVALLMQALGVLVERADSSSSGDNIGGLVVYLPLFVFLLMQYSRSLDVLDRAEAEVGGEEAREEGLIVQFPAA